MSLDNSVDKNNPRVQNVVRKGYLKKLKTLKKKFFVLKSDTKENSACLEYYDSEKKFSSNGHPKKVIPIKKCFNINRRLDTKHKHVIALYTKEEIFCLVLDSEEDLRGWLNDLFSFFEDGSEELIQPTQHVWLVNVQKRGLGGTNNILGYHHLCLTDRSLSLVKIKSKENIMCVTEPVIEFSLKNIRRCGHSESFFYMEVGRLSGTGAGELWMHTDDSNIAESMHSTILSAMQNLSKISEKDNQLVRGRSNSASAAMKPTHIRVAAAETRLCPSGICVGSCLNPCVTNSASYEVATRIADKKAESSENMAEIQPTPNNSNPKSFDKILSDNGQGGDEPLHDIKMEVETTIKHIRTTSLPVGREAMESVVHGRTFAPFLPPHDAIDTSAIKNRYLDRRGSTGARLYKRSPSHPKNGSNTRVRADSVPARPPPSGVDETDSHPRAIPEEPDAPDGYLPMAPGPLTDPTRRRLSPAISDGSVASGTPSTDLRFAEYHLEPATSLINASEDDERGVPIPRAYSVGSRPTHPPQDSRVRAFSVGSHARPRSNNQACSAPHLPPRVDPLSADLMELDFSDNRSASPRLRHPVVRSPPLVFSKNPFTKPRNFHRPEDADADGYVDMSPGSAYVDMRPEVTSSPALGSTPDGYVEMSFGGRAESEEPDISRSPEPSGSQTIFPLDGAEDVSRLATVRENSEESGTEYVALTTPVLNYAALDLQTPRARRPQAPHTYSQIDFARSEKLNALDSE